MKYIHTKNRRTYNFEITDAQILQVGEYTDIKPSKKKNSNWKCSKKFLFRIPNTSTC